MKQAKSIGGKLAGKANAAPKTVDEYFARVPEPAHRMLNKIRALIRSAVPVEATEALSYGMPTFKYKGSLVCYGAFANHCSFFPMNSSLIGAHKDELRSFQTSKGTIRLPLDKPLPSTVLKKMVKARVKQNQFRKEH